MLAVIAILAGIAVPKFREYKHRYFLTTMRSDLANLALAEESYWSEHDVYSTDLSALNYAPSPQVSVSVLVATGRGWSARATDAADPSTCAVFYGDAAPIAPATTATFIACE